MAFELQPFSHPSKRCAVEGLPNRELLSRSGVLWQLADAGMIEDRLNHDCTLSSIFFPLDVAFPEVQSMFLQVINNNILIFSVSVVFLFHPAVR